VSILSKPGLLMIDERSHSVERLDALIGQADEIRVF